MVKSKRVALLGQPNVGKSSLFNRLVGKKKSLVADQPGVTRDWISETTQLWDQICEIIDTPGITDEKDLQKWWSQMPKPIDLILWILDAKQGSSPLDRVIFRFLKEQALNYLILINKVDRWDKKDLYLADFWELASEDPFPISVEHKLGLEPFYARLIQEIEKSESSSSTVFPDQWPRLMILGRPNVGKSTLFNQLLGYERSRISPQAHTTRDIIATPFEWDHTNWILLDTAGLSRKKPSDTTSQLAQIKTLHSLNQADLVILMIDASEGITHQDADLLAQILEKPKCFIIAANKWDKLEPWQKASFQDQVTQAFHFFPDAIWVPISAQKGWNLNGLLKKAQEIWLKSQERISTAMINQYFQQLIETHSHLMRDGTIKIYYVTQTKKVPPVFLMFVNQEGAVNKNIKRFLINQLKEKFGFQGIPITLVPLTSR